MNIFSDKLIMGKKILCPFFLALLHTCFSFYTDNFVFAGKQGHIVLCVCLKLAQLLLLTIFWYFLLDKNNVQIVVYSMPYFIILLVLHILHNGMTLSGDEQFIYNCVTNWNVFPGHFMYFTGLVYALSLMILPSIAGIYIIKIFLQALLCGYCIVRFKLYYRTKCCVLLYFLFLFPPVLQNGIRIHRMQYYALLYLFLVIKLVFDYKSSQTCSRMGGLLMMAAFSSLAIWRKEGIYLLFFAPLILCAVYHVSKVKDIIKTFSVFLLVFVVLYSPQLFNSTQSFTSEDTPTYNGWLVNMCREGLDQKKYIKQMNEIDQYISVDKINRINKELGEANYEDNYIAILEEYNGIQADYSQQDVDNYKKAVRYLVIHEPIIFLKTRIGLWNYTSHNASHSIRIMKSGFLFFIYGMTSNLDIPLISIILLFIYSIISKKFAYTFISAGLIIHTGITLMLSPAAYFKYYYQMYLVGYFFIFILVMNVYCKYYSIDDKNDCFLR